MLCILQNLTAIFDLEIVIRYFSCGKQGTSITTDYPFYFLQPLTVGGPRKTKRSETTGGVVADRENNGRFKSSMRRTFRYMSLI